MFDERFKTLNMGEGKLYVLGVIHGLADEKKYVTKAFNQVRPSCVAVAVPPEDLETLDKISREEKKDFAVSPYEEDLLIKLADYGEVAVPPPDLMELFRLCKEFDTRIVPVDMDDKIYSEVFIKSVSTLQLFRSSKRLRKLSKKKFEAPTPEIFIKEWDGAFTSIKGFGKVEKTREEFIANSAKELLGEYGRVLLVVPLQRMAGVVENISKM
ncbi:MAG: hypothetical protein CVT48_04305 [Thermoplasmata archaeon HGW-Thermoplasmata-1]|nr:MAG: hypothetical protein CVT48_04305 [Thermoplasmata archaeon HGW-Thermoplasmata-1]